MQINVIMLLSAVGIGLLLWVIRNLIVTGKFTTPDAIGLLGVVVAVIGIIVVPPNKDTTSVTPIPGPTTTAMPTDTPVSPPNIWQLNPILPQPQGFVGWRSTGRAEDFQSGIWSRGVNVSIAENQLLLVFGGLANVPSIGEMGTRTSCFVIASRGPLNLSLDLMSARLEVHDVDKTATSLAWVAEKAKVLREVYPSTCGQGLDIAVGK